MARSLTARVPRAVLAGLCLTLGAAVLLLTARPADAATISGNCSASAASFAAGVDPDDPANLAIDAIEIPENSSVDNGTKDNPFELDSQGPVAWSGQTSGQATNQTWGIEFLTIGSIDDSDPNTDDERTKSGVKDMSDIFPADVTGLIKVTGTFKADGANCKGSGWIKLVGSPTGTIPWIGGLAAGALGLIGLAFATPKAIPVAAAMVPEAGAAGTAPAAGDAAAGAATEVPPEPAAGTMTQPQVPEPPPQAPEPPPQAPEPPPQAPEPPQAPDTGPGEGTV